MNDLETLIRLAIDAPSSTADGWCEKNKVALAPILPLAEEIYNGYYSQPVADVEFENYENASYGRNVRRQSDNLLEVVEHATRRGENLAMKVTFRVELGDVRGSHFKDLVEKALEAKTKKDALEAEIQEQTEKLNQLKSKLENLT